jgi:hypothetical protein
MKNKILLKTVLSAIGIFFYTHAFSQINTSILIKDLKIIYVDTVQKNEIKMIFKLNETDSVFRIKISEIDNATRQIISEKELTYPFNMVNEIRDSKIKSKGELKSEAKSSKQGTISDSIKHERSHRMQREIQSDDDTKIVVRFKLSEANKNGLSFRLSLYRKDGHLINIITKGFDLKKY